MNIRIGRWHLEWHQRAIHITRLPDPDCPDCGGTGGGWAAAAGRFTTDWDECHCLDQLHTWRLPLGPRGRRGYTPEPF